MYKILLVIASLVLEASCQLQPPSSEDVLEVTYGQGTIRGVRRALGKDRFYYAFKSIPYAQTPVGDLRFRDPVPAGNWSGTKDGSLAAPECPQIDLRFLSQGLVKVKGQEDCLYLNVYTPKPLESGLPVMISIHGGAFLVGNAEDALPSPLLTEDVVVVTLQYRLGTLGFLSTEDSVIPGNFGLKDQTMALRWIKDHIQDFGGDPQRITLFGTSAGAVSVHLQVLTPYAEGLFDRAILQSGTALCPWALRKGHRQVAEAVGEALDCSQSDASLQDDQKSLALLQCFQNATLEGLVTAPLSFVDWSNEPFVMLPRIDGDYLPEDPASILKNGAANNVSIITGINSHDGAITTNSIYGRESLKVALVENFTVVGPLVMNFRDGDESPEYLARRVFHRYLGDIEINPENADAVTKLFTDRLFGVCSDQTALLHAVDVEEDLPRVYSYELHHPGQHKYFPTFNSNVTEKWVTHGDDLQYLFDIESRNLTLNSPADLMVRHIMVKLWTNFAAYGNPTPDQSLGFRWEPVTSSCFRHLRLNPDSQMQEDQRAKVRSFFEDLPTVQNKILFPEKFETFSNFSYSTPTLMGHCSKSSIVS